MENRVGNVIINQKNKRQDKMKPTAALLKRFRKFTLTTKDINKGFYKGTGSGSMGRHTKHGGYVIEWDKVRTYVVPADLDTFNVCFFSLSFKQMRGRW